MSTRQLTLDLPHRPALGRQDFIVSEANRDAVGWIDRWPDWPHHALIVTGRKGSGKSHLAAVWCHLSAARRLEALALNQDIVRQAQEGACFAIEEMDGGAFDQQALFDLLNAVQSSGGSLLLTATRELQDWQVVLPDLASRLRACPRAALGPPDEDLLAAVMVKLLADRQLSADAHVLDYAIRRMPRSLDQARALVEALDRHALAHRRAITRPLVAEVLALPEFGLRQ